jgi:hypothetical protein
MKKLQTKEQRAKKEKKNQIIVGVIMVGLLVLSTAGFALMNTTSGGSTSGDYPTREYNGFEFVRQNNLWITQVNQKTIAFGNLPDEIEDVEINTQKGLSFFLNKPLYVVNGNESTEVIRFNMLPEYVLRVNEACLEGEICENEELPVKSCDNDVIIIFQNENSPTIVYDEGNCIYIEGNKEKGADKLLHQLLGI